MFSLQLLFTELDLALVLVQLLPSAASICNHVLCKDYLYNKSLVMRLEFYLSSLEADHSPRFQQHRKMNAKSISTCGFPEIFRIPLAVCLTTVIISLGQQVMAKIWPF